MTKCLCYCKSPVMVTLGFCFLFHPPICACRTLLPSSICLNTLKQHCLMKPKDVEHHIMVHHHPSASRQMTKSFLKAHRFLARLDISSGEIATMIIS